MRMNSLINERKSELQLTYPTLQHCWECCIQWMAIPSIIYGQSNKKGNRNCSSKGSNQHFLKKCLSTHYVPHNYKVSRNSNEQFQCNIFHFHQITKFKKGHCSQKKIESKCPVDMHIYTLCPSLLQRFRKFDWAVSEVLRWPTVSVVSFIFVKFRSSKRAFFREKKWNPNFL